MAVQGFKGLGWFLCGVIVAPACYLVNSYGAGEQARLNATRAAIVQAQKDIRQLETEFNTRANLAQLERWNGEVLAMNAPAPQQYLAGESALADLGRPADGTADVQVAALVVPAGAPPVQAAAPAMASTAPRMQTAAVQTGGQAVAGQAAAAQGVGARSVAQQDKELRGLMKRADRRTVAMVGNGGGMLSASTMDDLQKLAKREKLALR
jgi:hypothetical protein